MIEQTLSIIKPDAVERNLESEIKSFFENNNLKILKSKKVQITKEEASEFFKNIPKIKKKLVTLYDVGLGYIRLGQQATTLSGG